MRRLRHRRTVVGAVWQLAGWLIGLLGVVATLAAAGFDTPIGPLLFIGGVIVLVLGASIAVYARP